jgi:hypothetical protein
VTAGVLAAVVVAAAALAGGCGSSKDSGFGASSSSKGEHGADGGRSLLSTSGSGTGASGTESATLGGSEPAGGPPDGAFPTTAAHGCDPTCAAAGGQCSNKVCVITENLGQVTTAAQQQLQAAGTADPKFGWTYPYDTTVFPRGLIPPTLQFSGAAPEAFLVHITYSSFDYTGYYGGGASQLKLSGPVWSALTEGAWATDAVHVAVTKLSGGQVSGPIAEDWSIAQGNMRGQIYYETYGSQIIGGAGIGIMSIAPGASAPTPIKKGCGNVCHTASADGSTLVANVTLDFASASYDLKNNASTIKSTPNLHFTYGGLYPDGSFLMSATNYRTWIASPSKLYDTTTGDNIPAPGWDGVIKNGGTTAFAPDGSHIAFIHEDLDDGMGSTLSIMDFSVGSHSFSNLRDLTVDSGQTIGWPAFTPDIRTIVYHAGSNQNFETDGGSTGNVLQVDIASGAAARLDALDGYTTSGSTYLPAMDPDLNFAPTVLPEAVGGYFWVVFTSHRSYGNILPTQANGDQNGQLWVAALDLVATPGKDSSHPAFYLDGQESSADNLRGFWVLPPCVQNGTTCETGDQCCSGYCGTTGAAQCTGEPAGACSSEYDRCTTSADCCEANAGYQCIGGYCAAPAAPPVATPK